jgi:integrase/recombinase XerC
LADSIRAHVDRFLARSASLGRAPNTIKGYRSTLLRFASACDTDDVSCITEDDVIDFLAVECANLSAGSRNAARWRLVVFLDYLVRRGKLAANPAAGVPPITARRTRPTFYRPDQAAAILQACRTPTQLLLCSLLLRHGQRISSVVQLRWSDVDLDRAVVYYPPVKHSTEPLALPLDHATARLLKAGSVGAAPEQEYIFPCQRRGKLDVPYISYPYAKRLVQEACRSAGVPYRGLHELRRTCITTLLRAGVPLHVVSKDIAGHASVDTTVRLYAGIDDDDVGAALRRLPF